jgi:hypothetical protein
MAKKKTIFILGFESLGLLGDVSRVEGDIEFQFRNATTSCSLDDAEGVIVLQGAYERFQEGHSYMGDYVDVHFNNDLILNLEKQINNSFSRGAWTCFLVDEILDRVVLGSQTKDISATDLTKRILNTIGVHERHTHSGNPYLSLKADEFKKYFHNHGVGKTNFAMPFKKEGFKEISVSSDRKIYAFEYLNTIFVLPFVPSPSTRESPFTVIEMLKELVPAVEDYRLRHKIALPNWLDEASFIEESTLLGESAKLHARMTEVEARLAKLRRYKGILTSTGETLKELVLSILIDFFGVRASGIEGFIEDISVTDDDGKVIALCEVKGKKGGVKREHINQVDSERERNGLPADTLGLLIINDHMDESGYAERRTLKIAQEQVDHAIGLNVLIIRTIDLLHFMLEVEEEPNRKEAFWTKVADSKGLMELSDAR